MLRYHASLLSPNCKYVLLVFGLRVVASSFPNRAPFTTRGTRACLDFAISAFGVRREGLRRAIVWLNWSADSVAGIIVPSSLVPWRPFEACADDLTMSPIVSIKIATILDWRHWP